MSAAEMTAGATTVADVHLPPGVPALPEVFPVVMAPAELCAGSTAGLHLATSTSISFLLPRNLTGSNPGSITSAPTGFSGENLNKAVSELKSYTEGTRKQDLLKKC